MLDVPLTSLSTGATLLFATNSCPISDYNFITLASTGASNAVYIPTDLILAVHSNQFGGYRYTLNDYGVLKFYFLPDGSGIYILSGISASGSSIRFLIRGYK